ncbi:hypothetical protein XI05_01495 [Bradyrhizobium sp. CCBAU 11357]|nr:hypothetical protein [Bradyrhizobium sp. CCBAU 11357]
MHASSYRPSLRKREIVAHSQLISGVDDGCAREIEEQAVGEFDPPAVIAEDASQTKTNSASVKLHSSGWRKGSIDFLTLFRF